MYSHCVIVFFSTLCDVYYLKLLTILYVTGIDGIDPSFIASRVFSISKFHYFLLIFFVEAGGPSDSLLSFSLLKPALTIY